MKKKILSGILIALLSLGVIGCNIPKSTVDSEDNNATIENKAESAEDTQSNADSGENENDNNQNDEQAED